MSGWWGAIGMLSLVDCLFFFCSTKVENNTIDNCILNNTLNIKQQLHFI